MASVAEPRRTRRILAVDGGGIRGLVPAMVLDDLARRIALRRDDAGQPAKPLWRCFDMIAGTSTGGIIACGLVAPASDDSGESACTPSDLVSLYRERGREIFPRQSFSGIRQLIEARYDPRPLEGILKDHLGGATTAQALTNLVVPGYDIVSRQAVFMAGGPDYPREQRYLLREVARATSAAPTYFPPARVHVLDNVAPPLTLVDGGVFANDPGLSAVVEALKLGWAMADLEVLSVGTGSQNRSFSYFDAKDWGALDWVSPGKGSPILSILMQGASSTIAYQLRRLLANEHGDDPRAPGQGAVRERYTRIDGILSANDEMDDASEENLEMLAGLARTWIGRCDAALDDWADRLAA